MRKYSFVIPVYQGKLMLKNTLEALNTQIGFSKNDYEVIVVDDGSTDNTEEFIKDMNRNYPLKYIYLERCVNSSRSRARNYGLKKANGDIIVFIDADIIVRNNFLLQLERCFSIEEDILVAGNRLLLNESVNYEAVLNGSVLETYIFDRNSTDLLEFRYKIFDDLSYNAGSMNYPFLFALSCNMAVPKKWLEKIGGFDEDLKRWGVEDIEMAYRLFKKGIKIVFNNKNEVLHQFHGVQGDYVALEQKNGVHENTEIFLKKHPDAFNIEGSKVHELFQSIATQYKELEADLHSSAKQIVLDFKDTAQLKEIKEKILELMEQTDLIVIVNDFVEDTDLDIWIQLHISKGCRVKYFPISRKLDYLWVEMVTK